MMSSLYRGLNEHATFGFVRTYAFTWKASHFHLVRAELNVAVSSSQTCNAGDHIAYTGIGYAIPVKDVTLLMALTATIRKFLVDLYTVHN